MTLAILLKLGAAAQLAVAVLNLFLVRMLRWRGELERLSLLPRGYCGHHPATFVWGSCEARDRERAMVT